MCLCPVALTRECCGKKYTAFVPCGKCEECIKDKQNEYVIRSIEESLKVGNAWFITLTYNDDTVPVVFTDEGEIDEETGEIIEYRGRLLSLNNKDIVNWKKRVRRSVEYHEKRKIDFSYLICGEYGPKTHRPHYHGLLIGLSDADAMKFKKDWESHHGFTYFSKVSNFDIDKVAAYTAKYITKFRELEDENVINGKVEKPRKITSVGFGLPTKERFEAMRKDILGDLWNEDLNKVVEHINPLKLEKKIKQIAKKRKYKRNGREYKLPTYYKRRIFYVKDPLTGKMVQSTLSKMVSKAVQMDVQSDFSKKLIELATRDDIPETYEGRVTASKIVCASEERNRQERAEMLFQTNIAALRKSRF